MILPTLILKTKPTRYRFFSLKINNDIKNIKKIFQTIYKIEVKDRVILDLESITVKKQ